MFRGNGQRRKRTRQEDTAQRTTTNTNTIRVHVLKTLSNVVQDETRVAFLAAFTAGLRLSTELPPRSSSGDFGVHELGSTLSLGPVDPLVPSSLFVAQLFHRLSVALRRRSRSFTCGNRPQQWSSRVLDCSPRLLETPFTPTEGHPLHGGCKHWLHQW